MSVGGQTKTTSYFCMQTLNKALMSSPGNINGCCDSIIHWFDEVSEQAGRVQTETLRQILAQNFEAEYLSKWLKGVNIQEMDANALESLYTRVVPLISHADLEPYIQRIARGERELLITKEPIELLSLSSGTSEGRQKLVPFTQHSSKTTLQIFKLGAAYRSRAYRAREGGRILEFIYGSKGFKTGSAGIKVATATAHYYASDEFKLKQEETKSFTCSPEAVISSGDYKQSTYCHLLLGIHFSDQVEFVTSTFAYSIVQAFTTFEEIWKEISNDIKLGELSSRISIQSVREAVLGIVFQPNPNLATRVQSICEELEKKDWFGLIPKLWPNAKYVYSIMTGAMLPYLTKLRHYSGDLPLVSGDYGSTESWIGVNLDPFSPPEKVTFAVVPTFSYFEFIPLDRQILGSNSPATDDFVEGDPVPLSRVKIGQEYEIVLTTFTGLYRCRLGDVVEVAGFHKNTPKLNFVSRRKLILNVNIDKNTEKDLQLVVDNGSRILMNKSRAELVDFTSHADVSNQPGHYVVYWEIKGDAEDQLLEECCKEMDASFIDPGYVVSRKCNSIGPLELCVVERGTFNKIMENFIANGASLNQFKTPRCTSNPALLRVLSSSTIKRFHSTAYDAS